MSEGRMTVEPVQIQRVRYESSRPFDEVLANLRRQVPRSIPVEAWSTGMEMSGGSSLASFEALVGSQVGTSGFMLFSEIDHGRWLPFYGLRRKLVRWILGNPLLAITMMRHDLEAGLYAPVELLLVENEGGDGSTVIYDLPSSLMATRENPPLLEAAAVLDAKLRDLVSGATGVPVSGVEDRIGRS